MKKPVVLIGMPNSEVILKANPQLERRFSMRETLEPFCWNEPNKQTEFRTFLQYLDQALPFPNRAHLSDKDTAYRIFVATDGVIGYVMKLVRRAAILAIDQKYDRVEIELLAKSYDERLASRAPERINPFKCDVEDIQPDMIDGDGAKKRRRKRSRKRD